MSSQNLHSAGLSPKAWISVGVFLVLLVLVVVTREDRVAVGIRTLELPALDAEKVEKIEVTGKAESIKGGAVLVKAGEGWTVAAPDKADATFAADASAVTALLDSLSALEAGTFVTARAEKHAELDIDDEKGLFVTFHQKGAAPLALVFGRYAQGGGNYLRLEGSDEVFVGKGSVAPKLQKDVDGWRKKKLLDVEADEVASVTVEPAGGTAYTVEAREESEGEGEAATKKTVWAFASGVQLPEGFRGDDDLVRRVATSAAGLRASAFLDEAKAADETGLGDAPALGRVVVKSKGGKTWAVRFGKEDDKKRVYAQIEGEAQVYLLPGYQTKNVLKALDELRDMTLARFEASAVERVVIAGAEGRLELAKQDGTWTLAAPATLPDGFEFDPARVDGMLAGLTRLKGQERFATPPAGHGTERATTTVTLTLAGGASKTIAFGADVPGDEGGKKVYVKGAEDAVVYAISQFQKTRFDKPLELVKKLPPPPPPSGMGGGGIPGMENLPPDVRKKLEESLRQQGLPGR